MGVNFGTFDAHKDDKFEKMVNNLVRAYATKIERDKEDDRLAKADARYEAEKLTRDTGYVYGVKEDKTDYSNKNVPVKFSNPLVDKWSSFAKNYKAIKDSLGNLGRTLKKDDISYTPTLMAETLPDGTKIKGPDGKDIPLMTQAKKDSLFNRAVTTTGKWDSNNDGVIDDQDELVYANKIAKEKYDDEEAWKKKNFLLDTQGWIDNQAPGQKGYGVPSEGDTFKSEYGNFEGWSRAQDKKKWDWESTVSNQEYKKTRNSFDSVLDTADGAFFDSILTGDGIDTWVEEKGFDAVNEDQKILLKNLAMDKINSRGQAIIKKYQDNPEGLKDMSDADRELYTSYLMHSEKEVVTQDQAPSHLHTRFQKNANLENPDGTVDANISVSNELAMQGGQSNDWNAGPGTIEGQKYWYRNKGNLEPGDSDLVNKFKEVVKDIVSHPNYDSNNGIGITKKGHKHSSGNQMMAITDFEGTDKTHSMYYDKNSNKFMVYLNGDYVELDDDAIAEMIEQY